MIKLFALSFKNLFRKGFRSFLTMLGIAIGVASVIVIGIIGRTGSNAVNSELDSLGINGLAVSASSSCEIALSIEDLEAVRKIPEVENAMPIMTENSYISSKGIGSTAMIWGIDSGAKQVISMDIKYGRGITSADVNSAKNVCLVDENLANKFYKRKNIVGKTISFLIGGVSADYEIVGITKPDSGILQSLMSDVIPNFVYVPYSTMQNAKGIRKIDQIAVKIADSKKTESISANIVKTLEQIRGSSGTIKANNLARQRDRLSNLLTIVTVALTMIGAISLLVAGLGIMTVMLVSVNERTREIGVKKAIGASSFKILTEFLSEALILSVIGSIIGTAVGIAVPFIGGKIFNMPVEFDLNQILISVGVAIATGVIFGAYPAYKASKLRPVEALRYK